MFSCSYAIGEEANVTCTACGHELPEDDTPATSEITNTHDTSEHPLHDDFREKVGESTPETLAGSGSAQSSSGGSSSASNAPPSKKETEGMSVGQACNGNGDEKRMLWRTRCHTLDPNQVRSQGKQGRQSIYIFQVQKVLPGSSFVTIHIFKTVR